MDSAPRRHGDPVSPAAAMGSGPSSAASVPAGSRPPFRPCRRPSGREAGPGLSVGCLPDIPLRAELRTPRRGPGHDRRPHPHGPCRPPHGPSQRMAHNLLRQDRSPGRHRRPAQADRLERRVPAQGPVKLECDCPASQGPNPHYQMQGGLGLYPSLSGQPAEAVTAPPRREAPSGIPRGARRGCRQGCARPPPACAAAASGGCGSHRGCPDCSSPTPVAANDRR